jgi:MFS family permease
MRRAAPAAQLIARAPDTGRSSSHLSSPRTARVAKAESSRGGGNRTGLSASHAATTTPCLALRFQTGSRTSGVDAHRVHALQGCECREKTHRLKSDLEEVRATVLPRRHPTFRGSQTAVARERIPASRICRAGNDAVTALPDALEVSERTTTPVLGDDIRVVEHRIGAWPWSVGIAPCFATFAFGSIAQGAPFVIVAASLEHEHVGSGWFAAVAAARLAPYLVCSPVAGALAGRHEARHVFAITGVGRGIVIVALAIAVGAGAPAGLLVSLLFLLVAFGTPGFPALMRVVHHAAPPAQLDRASTVAAGLESAAFCAGPALGGLLLLVATDAVGSLLVCAAMMLISAGLATSLRTVSAATRQRDWLPDQRIRTAGRCLVDSRIRPAVVAVLGVNVIAGLDAALLVRLPGALDPTDERSFGLMSLAHGAGAFVAFFALVGPIPRCRRPLLPLIVASGAVVVLGATDELSVAVVACFAIGASILTSEAVVTSAVGRTLPSPLVAPAFGVLDAWMVAAMVAGAALAPLLTVTVGLQPSFVLTGFGIPFLAIAALHRRSIGRDDRESGG